MILMSFSTELIPGSLGTSNFNSVRLQQPRLNQVCLLSTVQFLLAVKIIPSKDRDTCKLRNLGTVPSTIENRFESVLLPILVS